MNTRLLLASATIAALAGPLAAQTVWLDTAGDALWSNANNWSAGVPINSSAVQIGTQPSLDVGFGSFIGLDTGNIVNTVASLTFNNTLTGSLTIYPLATETLTVTGTINNNSGFTQQFDVQVEAGGNGTWTGPLQFKNILNIGLRSVTLSDSISVTGSNLNFDINSLSSYGRFLGSGSASVSGVIISVAGSYVGNLGDSFDLTSSNFSGATIGSLPTLTGGLMWDTSAFLSSGLLTVTTAVPEPATWATLAGLAAMGTVACRRRRRYD